MDIARRQTQWRYYDCKHEKTLVHKISHIDQVLMNSQLDVTWEATLCILEHSLKIVIGNKSLQRANKSRWISVNLNSFQQLKKCYQNLQKCSSLVKCISKCSFKPKLFFKENVSQCPSQIMKCTNIELFILILNCYLKCFHSNELNKVKC